MADAMTQHILTTNTMDGKATFYEHPKFSKTIPSLWGSSAHIYTNPQLLPDMSSGAIADLDTTAEHGQTGLATMNGRICPDKGLSTAILVLKPGAVTPMHRTRTVDIGILLEGEVTMELDNNELRTLRKGDTFVQRGTIHQWSNRTDKEVKMFAVVIDAKPIIDGHGEELTEVWL